MLSNHFTDNATLEKYEGVDPFNVREFQPPIQIKCRKMLKTTVIKSAGDEDVVSKSTLYLDTEISELDRIDGQDILAIDELRSLLTDQIVGYKVYV